MREPAEGRSGKGKSERAIRDAFDSLIVSKPYATISVGSLVSRADVGRSTFYEHYASKDALLKDSLQWIAARLAGLVAETCDEPSLAKLLDHFLDVRELVLDFFQGPQASILNQAIQEAILARSGSDRPQSGAAKNDGPGTVAGIEPDTASGTDSFRAKLVAETVTAMIRVWVEDRNHLNSAEFVPVLHRTARTVFSS